MANGIRVDERTFTRGRHMTRKTDDAVDKLRGAVYYITDGDMTKPNAKLEKLLDDIISTPHMTNQLLGNIKDLIWEMR